ncbi:MAG: aldehyde ferredoxin oxidoreductase C-terminal domain-containing protein, partial [Chloroflexota bacterium]
MDKLYGYAGKLLRIDLTNEKVTEEKLDEATLRKWVGGTGLGAKYLWEEVPASVKWSDEGNRIIIASGPLGGTVVSGSGTLSVVTRGTLTGGAVATQANGFFGAYLKFNGLDGIILQGKAKRWVYLYINGNNVEFKDASGLTGKDTWETNDLVRKDLGATERGVAVASIGPAGENLVKFASIWFDKGHTSSHNGVGAVLGSKMVKAIALTRSRGRPAFKDKERLAVVADQLHANIVSNPATRGTYEYGTLNGVVSSVIGKNGTVPVRNYSTNVFDITSDKLDKFSGSYIRSHYEPKPNPCWACRMHHCHMMKVPEGEYKGYVGEEPEYECYAAFGPVIGVTDASATFVLANEADRLGIDCNEAGWTVGLAMECFEKGLLTTKDTDGLQLNWGNYNAANELIHKIARREGFGDVLAEGAMRAAERIGGEAKNFALHTMKGNTPRGHDHRNIWPMLFDTCVSQMSTDEGFSMSKPQELGINIKPPARPNNSVEDTVASNVSCKGAAQFEDCLGTCRFTGRTDVKLLCEGVSAATGWDFPALEGMEVGRRIVNLLRAFNVRCGHTAAMDAPSPRYGSAPPDGPSAGKTIMPFWNELRSRYYEGMGWDKETGKPLPETLKRYGLEFAIP